MQFDNFELDVLVLLNEDSSSPVIWRQLLTRHKRSWTELVQAVELQSFMEEITL